MGWSDLEQLSREQLSREQLIELVLRRRTTPARERCDRPWSSTRSRTATGQCGRQRARPRSEPSSTLLASLLPQARSPPSSAPSKPDRGLRTEVSNYR